MMSEETSPSLAAPKLERVRHDLKWRTLTVAKIERLSPGMLRLHLTSDELSDFTSLSPDDHIKILLPNPDGDPFMRDYTPRLFDNASASLVIDFAVHEAGPATLWALSAKIGDTVKIGGPRGSVVIKGPIAKWLLVGDEAALPAIGRRIEETEAGISVTSVIAVESSEDRQSFVSAAAHDEIWVHRPLSQGDRPDAMIAALDKIDIGTDTFVWIAAEAKVAKAIRVYMTEKRGIPAGWFKAAGYWQKGEAGAHVAIE
ncbi:siderophore-interacting protein [Rhizobium sp. C4]|uniref:siderophore-interacting protein n=1 Tax=Rhizobium sp. C4 TaxID=1349800 RepID=UPI001E2AF5AD|nr:siderophore-interacting protein [Rhizobium sp. C4]MCD2173477.1 siderophore-interacting protein [Rhizobium sp. C4]